MIQRILSRILPTHFKWQPYERTALVFFIVFSIGFSVLPVLKSIRNSQHNKDYSTWERVALIVEQGRDLFPPEIQIFDHNFFYPPAIASLFYTPLHLLAGPIGMVVLLCLLSALGHALSILLSVRMATGKIRGQHPALYIIPFLITVPFVWDIYFLGQLNLSLLALMLLAFAALEAKRPWSAGALLALSAAAKAFPLTSIVYLIWKRKWAATLGMVLSLVVILLILPTPIRGWERNLSEVKVWTHKMLFQSSGESLANQADRAYKYGNQTLVSAVHRLTRPLDVGGRDDQELKVNLISVSPAVSFGIFFFLAGALGLTYVALMPPPGRETAKSRALEFAILLIFIVIFSPKAGSFYYCWLLPALTLIVHECLQTQAGSQRRRILGSACGFTLLVMASALTQIWDRTTQAMGATTWGAVLLSLILLALLREQKLLSTTSPASNSEQPH
ncbi:MAG: DUF2029 domain-containing protein [Blastochloris sp.]|nr:DUF2029 domain-containing protein [Blastochloris sp.]